MWCAHALQLCRGTFSVFTAEQSKRIPAEQNPFSFARSTSAAAAEIASFPAPDTGVARKLETGTTPSQLLHASLAEYSAFRSQPSIDFPSETLARIESAYHPNGRSATSAITHRNRRGESGRICRGHDEIFAHHHKNNNQLTVNP